MKKIFLSLVALVAAAGVWAQEANPMLQPIPNDPALRVGVLENGMRYYIRHNEKPKDLANFWIVYDVGAIQEEDDQQGLAHFLEHMAFNGTKNLPNKQLIEYCEKVGVAFGRNLNAATSWDYTFYQLNDVPVKRAGEYREGVIDSMLMILHDWSHFIALKGEEIDSERGVIMEELRTTDGAQRRGMMKLIESLGKGTRYAERNLIGHLDFLASFPHSAIRSFYEKWYRPELMTFIVVGDIDVDQIESKIQQMMTDVPLSPADAAQKEVIVVPDNEEPIISIFTDPEMQRSQATLYVKHPALPKEVKGTIMSALVDMVDSYLAVMANARLQEITMQPDAPFLSAYIHNGSVGIIPTLETAMLGVTTKDGELTQGFAAAMLELERMRRHGFTVGEFERARAELQAIIDRQYANRNDNYSSFYVERCMNNFLEGAPVPDAEVEYQIDNQLLQIITLDMVNARLGELFVETNQVVAINAPEKEGVENPTEEQVMAILQQIPALPAEYVEPYADDTVIEPLISEETPLQGSKIVSEKENKALGTMEWTLANGTRIILKKTDFKADEVLFGAVADGGAAMIEDNTESAIAAQLLPSLRGMMGLANFSATDLRKQLSGKVASVNPFVSHIEHGLRGSASPKDLETLMQLVYLNFTAPRFSEDDFRIFYNQYKNYLENMNTDPDYIFQKRLLETVYGGDERAQVISADLLDKVDFARLEAINATLFPDANDFVFTFVGNVDPETLRPLVEKYIGSIPTSEVELSFVDDHRRVVKGEVVRDFNVAMQQPKVSLFVALTGDLDYTLKNRLTFRLLTSALSNRYLETVREKMGATYSIGAAGSIDFKPTQEYFMQVMCDTNERQADHVVATIIAEIARIYLNGPLAEDIDKTREFLLKNHKGTLEDNGYWLSYLNEFYNSGIDLVNDYEETLRSITHDDVKALAGRLLQDGNIIKVIMRPEKAE